MPIQTYTLPNSLQFVVRFLPPNDDLETYDRQILAELTKALDLIEQSASDSSIYYQTFSIAPPPRKGSLDVGKTDEAWTLPSEIDPWNVETCVFWTRVGSNPGFHMTIKAWLERVLSMLERVKNLSRSTDGLWENDEVQFAEPAISILATMHSDFVPFYTRFLAIWDMDHEVTQHEVILKIFERHGITEKTEDLIIVRTADGLGQAGSDTFEEVLPLLNDHYGDIEGTDFLKRLVVYHHAHAVLYHAYQLQEKYESYKRRFLKYSQTQPTEISCSLDAWFLESQPALSEKAMPLFEDLERKRLARA